MLIAIDVNYEYGGVMGPGENISRAESQSKFEISTPEELLE
jgi:hypothetical protein